MRAALDVQNLAAIRLVTVITGNRHPWGEKEEPAMPEWPGEREETGFAEFRRKIRAAEVLSAAMERLLSQIQFNGKVSVVVQNGRILKSGYEEGYFRQS